MADQTANFNVKSDTSGVDKLANSLKNLDNTTSELAKAFSKLNSINQSAPKNIDEVVQSVRGLSSGYKELSITSSKAAESLLRVTASTKSIKQEQIDLKATIDETSRAIKNQSLVPAPGSGPGFVGPPIPPAVALGGTSGPDPFSDKAKVLATRAEVIRELLQQLKIDVTQIDDKGTLDRLRSKINALAQTAGISTFGINSIGRAFQRIENETNFDAVTGKLARVINRVQDLAAISRRVAADQQKDVEQTQKDNAKQIAGLEEFDKARVKSARLLETVAIKAKDKDTLQAQKSLDAERQLELQRQRIAQTPTVLTGALGAVGISDRTLAGLDPARAQAARVAINQLATAMAAGKINADDLTKAVAGFNSRGINPLIGGAAAAQAALGRIKAITETTGNSFGFLSERITGFGGLLISVLIRRALFALTTAVRNAFIEVFKFETALVKTGVSASLTDSQIAKLEATVRNLALSSGRVRLDIATASLELFRNKAFDAVDASESLQIAIDLAKLTFVPVSEAAKALSNTLGEYGLSAQDATRVSKLLFAATTAGRADLKDIENVLGGTSVAAKQLEIPLETVLAAFTSLREQGVPAAKATQTLNNLFNRLVQSTPELNQAFGKFGFESAQAAVRAKGLEGALRIISEESKNGAGRVKAFGDALLGSDPNISKISTSLRTLQDEVDSFDKKLEQVNRSSEERFQRAAAVFRGGFTNIAEAFKRTFVDFVEVIGDRIKRLKFTDFEDTANKVKIQLKEIRDEQDKVAETTERSNKKTLESYRSVYSDIRKGAFDTLLSLRQQFQNTSTIVEENFKTLGELVKKISSDANTNIKAAQREIVSFSQDIAKRSFERRIQILPPAQQFQELNQRITESVKAGQEFAKQGKLQESVGAFNDAKTSLLKIEEINDKLAQQQGRIAVSTDNNFRTHAANIDKITNSQDKLTKENVRFLNQELALLRRNAQQTTDPFIRNNKLAEVRAREIAAAQRDALTHFQTDQRGLADVAIQTEKKINIQEDTGVKRIVALQAQEANLRKQINEAEANRPKILGEISETLKGFDTALPIRISTAQLREEIKTVSESLGDFIKKPTDTAFEDLRQKSENLIKFFSKSPELKGDTGLDDRIAKLRDLLLKLQTGGGGNLAQAQLDIVQKQIEAVKVGPAALGDQFQNATISSQGLITNINTFNVSLDTSLDKVTRLLNLIQQIGITPIQAPQIQEFVQPGLTQLFPPVLTRQHGGMISHGQHGIDRVPIMATRGEFVVNADASRRFYPQLVAINSGRFPGFQHGGQVTNTSVGNITVNVSAQNTEQGNIRNIAGALNREIRRGTVRFG